MKKFLSLLLIAVVFTSCVDVDVDDDAGKAIKKNKKEQRIENTGVFVHITHGSDDPHRALMGLMMADKMAEDKDVVVYLDINGIELVQKDAAEVNFPEFPSSKSMVSQLLEKNITIMACPGCMKALGVTEDMLIEGVIVAKKDKFFDFTDGRILTLDY